MLFTTGCIGFMNTHWHVDSSRAGRAHRSGNLLCVAYKDQAINRRTTRSSRPKHRSTALIPRWQAQPFRALCSSGAEPVHNNRNQAVLSMRINPPEPS